MSPSLPYDLKLGPVKLKVSDLSRSLAFYREVVGLGLLQTGEGIVHLTADGHTPLVILEELADAQVTPRRSVAGLYHFAILLPSRKDLGAALHNLIRAGIHIGQADHLVSEALYIADPDHNGIEIYCDRPRDTWRRDAQGNYIMATDPIDWDGLLALAQDVEWEGLPPGTTMGHIHFHVQSLQKSKHFYCEVLGFDIAADVSSRGALFVSAGGYHHHIGLNIWAGENAPLPAANATGLAYYTVAFPDSSSLQQALGRLRSEAVPISEKPDGFYAVDPSGITLRMVSA
ncbi:VOC family protein [Paenibacillus puerhi]|uniref:VOC family protein n=1 Tax=Paenibacillus puerhi TaxID=2692622 RepID=UPI00135BDED1|nr:VOC family protein [Paenibacillus puerhi]